MGKEHSKPVGNTFGKLEEWCKELGIDFVPSKIENPIYVVDRRSLHQHQDPAFTKDRSEIKKIDIKDKSELHKVTYREELIERWTPEGMIKVPRKIELQDKVYDYGNYRRMIYNRLIPVSINDRSEVMFINLDANQSQNQQVHRFVIETLEGDRKEYYTAYIDIRYLDVELSKIFFKDHKKMSPRRMTLIRRYVTYDDIVSLGQLSELLGYNEDPDSEFPQAIALIRAYFHRMNRIYKILKNNRGEIPIETIYY